MIELKEREDGYEELNLPVARSIDTPQYRKAYAELMQTSRQTRESGLTYLGFLSRMRRRNLARRKLEFERRVIVADEKHNPLTYRAMLDTLARFRENEKMKCEKKENQNA